MVPITSLGTTIAKWQSQNRQNNSQLTSATFREVVLVYSVAGKNVKAIEKKEPGSAHCVCQHLPPFMSAVMTVSSGAWLLGVERFVSTLSPEQRQAFRTPASAEDCLLLIHQAQLRNRKLDRFAEMLRPLIEPLRRFEASIDVLIQTYSTVASPVWGPIRVVITLVSDRLSALASIATLLQRLAAPLIRFKNYEAMFENDLQLRSAIGSLYCDLIEFCTRIVSHSSKNLFRKNFGSFDRDVSEISERIKHHWTEVDVAANARGLAEAKMARQAEELSKALNLRKDINKWLSPSNVEDDLRRLLSTYMKGSCDWIINREDFMVFLKTPGPQAIRVSGFPGGGKSTAAAFMIQHITEAMKGNVLYFFCRATDTEKTYTLHIFRTLVWQMLQTDGGGLYQHMLAPYYRSGRRTLDSETEAFALLSSLLRIRKDRPVYIVLDALDECDDVTSLLPLLSTTSNLRIIITGREDPVLTSLFKHCDHNIMLQSQTSALADYIQHRVSTLEIPIGNEMRTEVTRKVTNASDGLWLFARLLLDEINQAATVDEIHRQLEEIPDGLAHLYSSLLVAKETRITKSQLKMAQQLFLFIDTSEFMPAWLWKDTPGDRLDDDMIITIFKFAMRSNSEIFKPMKIVQDIASPLIHTRLLHSDFGLSYPAGLLSDSPNFVTEFFHQTARQYLSWSDDQPLERLPACLRPRRLSALHRGACAMWYFSESREFKYSLQHLRERPRSGRFECHAGMASGLWQSLKLRNLRSDLTDAEIVEAKDLCQQLSGFVTSTRCLDFVEVSLILHLSQPSRVILDDIDAAYEASSIEDLPESTPAFLIRLFAVRRSFMRDLGYVVASGWPGNKVKNTQDLVDKYSVEPDGFASRSLMRAISGLAHRYQWLLHDGRTRSSDCFLLTGSARG